MIYDINKYICFVSINHTVVRVIVFNATFDNISVYITSYWQTLSHKVASSIPCHERDSN